MATKLEIWNQALVHLGSAPLPTLLTETPAKNVFTNAWGGVVAEAMTEGSWSFAQKSVEIVASAGTPSAGFSYAFDYPDDYEQTISVCPEPQFVTPFYAFRNEGGILSANITPIYLRYIRNDLTDDAGIATWPTFFWRFVAAKLAYETCERITQSTTGDQRLERIMLKALRKAKSVNARNEPGELVPQGSWMRARNGGAGVGRGGTFNSIGAGEIVLGEGDV